ncbi:hypothetical protein SPAR97_1642 [Streptococcus pneumoniae GA47461]|nr:hypothetical protein SP108700_1776 [Streptococcus pneumoniae CDC1087-00]EHD26999.1 hypothetical protein SPAR98_1970 [Streptococcus pneumoniae GA47502]EHD48455.1 hypothetical protein SPAR40_1874 [Streptococcus pneumoniae GA16531]EHD63941.1 hypothetical protein SPAR72_1854 [Streptococcus pneumoniae GA41538]EHE28313.1 hypothetical protein SPAR91_1756 [Streptococcus pneumoniae GA47283]EHE37904.1 hypothetical protein SPAR119_1651 [Streptococcus pneumoniae GA47439]EHZ08320.1 hypothetical protein
MKGKHHFTNIIKRNKFVYLYQTIIIKYSILPKSKLIL